MEDFFEENVIVKEEIDITVNELPDTRFESDSLIKQETDEKCEPDSTYNSIDNDSNKDDCEEPELTLEDFIVEENIINEAEDELESHEENFIVINDDDDDDDDDCQFVSETPPTSKKKWSSPFSIRGNYKCGFCFFKTKFRYDLKTHCVTKHSKTVRICPKCLYNTSNKTLYKLHMSTHNPEKVPKTNEYKTDLINQSKDTSLFHCDECDYKTPYKSYVKSHARRSHTEKLRCKRCKFIASSTVNLKLHEARHQIHCDFCSYSTVEEKKMQNHLKMDHKYSSGSAIKPVLLKCGDCKFQTNRVYSLQIHQLTHLEDELKLEYRQMCGTN